MNFFRTTSRFLLLAGICLLTTLPTSAWEALRAHPENPYLFEFRGKPKSLRTFGEHYSSVINSNFDYTPYLDVLARDRLNLTRLFLVGFREHTVPPNRDPLAPTPANFLQPWQRTMEQGAALDGLGKWDFSTWNEDYFNRLEAFVQACSDRGIVVEMTLFCTFYTPLQWQASPFNPENNVQGHGPVMRYDCYRPENSGLLEIQESVTRRIVRQLNRFDNIYFSIQNEPFWNEPSVKDEEEVAYHELIRGYIRDEESNLPNRHLIAHNFPGQIEALSEDFDVINEHYPAAVPDTGIAGAEALLDQHYSRGKILSMDETDPATPNQGRLESWMFLMGGGGVVNGLDYSNLIHTEDTEAGDSELGNAMRAGVRNIGIYVDALHQIRLRRDLSWINGVPTGAKLQAMSNPGQQYTAYLHHGASGLSTFQLRYNPIDPAEQTIAPTVTLPEGSWRAVWTRPSDLGQLHVEEFTHAGGSYTMEPVQYSEDIALRIDRTGSGDLTPPPPPEGLKATAQADGSVLLSWNPGITHDLASHRIYRSLVGADGISPERLLTSLPADLSEFVDASAVPGQTYYYQISAVDENGNESIPGDEVQIVSSLMNRPYGGSPLELPGRIEAEDFDLGGNGVAYLDLTPSDSSEVYRVDESVEMTATDDDDGSFQIICQAGEWLEYTVNIEESGLYRFDARALSVEGGGLSLSLDGGNTETSVLFAGSAEWETIAGPEMLLEAGQRVLRISLSNDIAGLNWFSFSRVIQTGPSADAGESQDIADEDSDGFAMITLDGSASTQGDSAITGFSWSIGNSVIANQQVQEVRLPVGEHEILLAVTDANGLQSSDSVTIRINSPGFINGSFENGLDGWTARGNLTIQSSSPYVPADGSKLLAFNNGNLVPNGAISQTFSTSPGTRYALIFNFGVLAFNNTQQRLGVEVTGNGVLLSQFFITNRINNLPVRWETKTLSFIANSGATTLSFSDLSTSTGSLDLTLDGIRIVPEVKRTLSVSSQPDPGVEIVVAPSDIAGQANGIADFTREFPNETTVTLTAAPSNAGLRFSAWMKDGNELANTPMVSVLMDGDHSLTAVYVVGPPLITQHPVKAVIAKAGNALFRVEAEGAGEISYQWRFNGIAIEGGTGRSLEIMGVQEAQVGTYDVVVSNDAGSVVSNPAELQLLGETQLLNGSFEDGFIGWTVNGNISVQSALPYSPTDGAKLAAFNGGQSQPNGILSQVLATTPGMAYRISFDLGVLAFNNSQQRVEVSVIGASTRFSQIYVTNRLNDVLVRWENRSFSFVADSSSTTLSFRDVSATSTSLDLTLDNVRLEKEGPRTLSISSTPVSGAAINVNPSDQTGLGGGSSGFSRTFEIGTTVQVTAALVSNGRRFEKWLKNGLDAGNSSHLSILIDADLALTAVYGELLPALPEGLKLLPLGDSITAGHEGTNAGFRGSLHDFMASSSPGFQYVGTSLLNPGSLPTAPINQHGHLGLSAYRIEDIHNNLDGLDETRFRQFESEETDPGGGYWLTGGNGTGRDPIQTDIITLKIGSNDIQEQSGVEGRLRNLIGKITTLRPSTKLLVAKIAPMVGKGDAVNSYNTIVSSVVTEFKSGGSNVHLVDLNTGFPANGLHPDGFHPNDIGFNWMAVRWYDAILASFEVVDPDEEPPVVPATLLNGSFETDLSDWKLTGIASVQPNIAPYTATHGTKILSFNSSNQAPNAFLSQSVATTPGASYDLSFDVGVISYNSQSQSLRITATGVQPVLSKNIVVKGTGKGNMRWTSHRVSFIADHTVTELGFRDVSSTSTSIDMFLDNVRLETNPVTATAMFRALPLSGRVPLAVTETIHMGQLALTGAPGAFKLGMFAPSRGNYVLERSWDLLEWQRAGEISADGPRWIEFEDNDSPALQSGRVFFRVGRLPDE